MCYGYGALKQKAADSYDYKTMIERIDAGYTKREQFLKDKKMLHQDKSL
jgi:hypothetical protein